MNTQHNLPTAGQIYLLKGTKFQVISVVAGIVRFASMHGNEIRRIPLENFNTLIEQRLLLPDPDSNHSSSGLSNGISRLGLSDREIADMNRRLSYARPIVKICPYPGSQRHVKQLIAEIAKEIGDEHVPGVSTVLKWIKTFRESNRNSLSLVPGIRHRGCRDTKFPRVIEKKILARIEQDYLTTQRLSAKKVYSHLIGDVIEQYGDGDILPQDLKLPSLRTFQRRIARIEPYQRTRARYGRHRANRIFKSAGLRQTATRPLEIVEGDGQILDIIVQHPTDRTILGRPYATVLIDRYTRVIVAIIVTFMPFSAPTLLRALKAGLGGPSRGFFGVFEFLVVDNGSDYISKSTKNFCNAAGTRIEHGSPNEPDTKPHIERFLGTLNTQLIHTLPGTTFSNPTARGDYDSEAQACLTIDELEALILRWIDTDYHVRVHSQTGRSPKKLWDESIKRHPVAPIPMADLDILARTVITRTITKGRITYANLTWYSPALAHLEQELKISKRRATVEVYVDELDLNRIYIKDPRDRNHFIQADSTLPKYTKGLSAYEHRLTQERLKAIGLRDLEELGQHALDIERWNTWKIIEALKTKTSRKSLARMMAAKALTASDTDTSLPVPSDDDTAKPLRIDSSHSATDTRPDIISVDEPSDPDDDAPFDSKRY